MRDRVARQLEGGQTRPRANGMAQEQCAVDTNPVVIQKQISNRSAPKQALNDVIQANTGKLIVAEIKMSQLGMLLKTRSKTRGHLVVDPTASQMQALQSSTG
eukprot:2161938-Rhodomonas_salina.1